MGFARNLYNTGTILLLAGLIGGCAGVPKRPQPTVMLPEQPPGVEQFYHQLRPHIRTNHFYTEPNMKEISGIIETMDAYVREFPDSPALATVLRMRSSAQEMMYDLSSEKVTHGYDEAISDLERAINLGSDSMRPTDIEDMHERLAGLHDARNYLDSLNTKTGLPVDEAVLNTFQRRIAREKQRCMKTVTEEGEDTSLSREIYDPSCAADEWESIYIRSVIRSAKQNITKIGNNYTAAVLSGHIADTYPDSAGCPIALVTQAEAYERVLHKLEFDADGTMREIQDTSFSQYLMKQNEHARDFIVGMSPVEAKYGTDTIQDILQGGTGTDIHVQLVRDLLTQQIYFNLSRVTDDYGASPIAGEAKEALDLLKVQQRRYE